MTWMAGSLHCLRRNAEFGTMTIDTFPALIDSMNERSTTTGDGQRDPAGVDGVEKKRPARISGSKEKGRMHRLQHCLVKEWLIQSVFR